MHGMCRRFLLSREEMVPAWKLDIRFVRAVESWVVFSSLHGLEGRM